MSHETSLTLVQSAPNDPNCVDPVPDLELAGYASLFGQRDMSGDIVQAGAFAASLLMQSGRALPMLFGHDTRTPIGVWDRVYEDPKGLFVSGRLLAGSPRAANIARLVMAGAVSGLSIGYQAVRHNHIAKGRALLEIDLFEISLVAFPMLRDARLTHIAPLNEGKHYDTIT